MENSIFVNMAIQAINISKSIGQVDILKEVSLEINAGEVVAICGPSGAGKTTLLQILGTLDQQDLGEVKLLDTNTNQLTDKKLSEFRNQHIGFVFQYHRLLPEFTALENILLPTWINKQKKWAKKQEAEKLAEFLGIAHCLEKKPNEMSGGECQRVAIARALINKPSIIMADEPSGSLDTENALQLHELFLSLRKEFNLTFLIVTHNKQLAEMSDRIIQMQNGQVI